MLLVPAVVFPPLGMAIALYRLLRDEDDRTPALTALLLGALLTAIGLVRVLSA